MNRILMTGDKGFVGSHIRAALEGEHEVVGLEARERFRDWYDDMYDVMDTSTPGAGVGADGVDGGGAAVVGKRTESGVKTRKRESEKTGIGVSLLSLCVVEILPINL